MLDSQRSDVDVELVNSHLNGSNLMCENNYPITESQMMLNESSEINSQLFFIIIIIIIIIFTKYKYIARQRYFFTNGYASCGFSHRH